MSHRPHSSEASTRRAHATVFAALGDQTRLLLVARLCRGQQASIVHGLRSGRESVFEFSPQPIEERKDYLDLVSRQWDALSRLKSFVETQESE